VADERGSGREPDGRRADGERQGTQLAGRIRPGDQPAVRRFRLTIVEAPDVGRSWESERDRCSIGSHPSNDLVIDDPTVSRFHCEVRVDASGARVRDLKSLNGTILDGIFIVEAFARGGSVLRLGRAALSFQLTSKHNQLPVSSADSFGGLVGASIAMRQCFALMERSAASDVTVLLEGETGTGKGVAAEAIHRAGARRDQPFVVVDCGAISGNLLESELFGHEKGAFTGAVSRRIGAFEEASGGTVFLDEIGELPSEVQPKLLRALESRQVRRVGSNTYQPVDVRLIAATNRDLRTEVNAGRFRPDLYFRLAVLKIVLPPLRERPEDLPLLVERMLAALAVADEAAAPLRDPAFLDALAHSAWPGNGRELRNHLQRCLVLQDALPVDDPDALAGAASGSRPFHVDATVPYAEARRRALDEFERMYLVELMRHHDHKVADAARTAQIGRVSLYRLMRRHGVKP
jgi:DNA-binding NtrC family response regulator